jgi:hypothetical protein
MTLERPMFPPRRGSVFRVVAGIDFAGSPAAEVTAPAKPRAQKPRAPHKDRRPIEYQEGEEDGIFRSIAEHRAAVAHYDRCVDIQGEAEGKVSDDEFFYLEHNTSDAFETMMLWARAVIIGRPTTRRGLIHQARYLASQFSEHVGWDEGACQLLYLPDNINDRPWFAAFLQRLAAGLRKMGREFDPQYDRGQS